MHQPRLGLGLAGRAVGPSSPIPTNIVAWYRGDQYTAGSWADLSGNAHTATQATGSQQPTINASDAAYGGQQTVSFAAASSQTLSTGSFSASTPDTVYVVGESSSSNTLQQEFYDLLGGVNQHTLYMTNTNLWTMYNGGALSSSNSTRGSAQAFCAVSNGASSALYINTSGTAAASGNAGSQAIAGGISLGAFNAASLFLNGKIAELIIYSGVAHTVAQISQNFKYFGRRYRNSWN